MRRVRPECPVHTARNVCYTFGMFKQYSSDDIHLETPHPEDEPVFAEKELQTAAEKIRQLRGDPRVEVLHSNVKMWQALKTRFKNDLPKNPKVMTLDAGRSVEVQLVFKNDEVTALVESPQRATALKALGINAVYKRPDTQWLDDKPNMLFALDADVNVTKKFVRNIESGGWLICSAETAAIILQDSYQVKCMGTLEPGPHLEKSKREDRWEHMVSTDEELKSVGGGDFVTYEEAVKALEDAERPTDNVCEEYKKLLDEQSNKREARATEVGENAEDEEWVQTGGIGKLKPLPLNDESKNKIFILKKRQLAID